MVKCYLEAKVSKVYIQIENHETIKALPIA